MKALTSIFRRARRPRAAPDAPRKRPGRSFATSAFTLEGRALLTTLGPAGLALSSGLSASAALASRAPAIVASPPVPPPSLVDFQATSAQVTITGSVTFSSTSDQAAIGGSLTVSSTPAQPTAPGSITFSSPSAQPAAPAGEPIPPSLIQSASADQGPPPPGAPQGGASPGKGGGDHPHDRIKNHVALDVKNVVIGGVSTPEFALADAGLSEVFVKLGLGGPTVTLGAAEGINHPLSVELQDVNGDGLPDLVVANTGGKNVLVFPGLAAGLFGPEVNGGVGFAVGSHPVSVSVDDLNHDGIKDLIVANAGSNTVSILYGQGQDEGWTAAKVETIQTMSRPVKAVAFDIGHDGITDLFVCNSGSDSVTMYQGQRDGTFNPTALATFSVGANPSEMFVGRFDKRLQVDLVTVNSGSDDVTFVGGVLGPRPMTQTVSSGGVLPDAAFAIDMGHGGALDLVVANSGDGHMAYLQAGSSGLQLAGVITQASVPVPTGLAASSWNGGGFDFYAAGAGQDAAELLHFDLGIASGFLPGPAGESTTIGGRDEELFSELMPFGDSSLELIAVFWAGNPESSAIAGERGLREPSMITAFYSPTEGQGPDEVNPTAEVQGGQPTDPARVADPSKADSTDWARFVLGLDAALGQPWGLVEAVAGRDSLRGEAVPPIDELAGLDGLSSPDRAFDPDVEAASRVVDEALRLFWSEGAGGDGDPPAKSAPGPDHAPALDGIDAPALEGQLESVSLISTALLLSTRLILGGSPPRPPTSRRRPGFRGFSGLLDARTSRERPESV